MNFTNVMQGLRFSRDNGTQATCDDTKTRCLICGLPEPCRFLLHSLALLRRCSKDGKHDEMPIIQIQ